MFDANGVRPSGFMRTVQPAASVVATLRAPIAIRKFPGVIKQHTPIPRLLDHLCTARGVAVGNHVAVDAGSFLGRTTRKI